ncbi:helix-turn-helix domain-containing protein [Streptomyces sp. NPDC055709]
MHVRDNQRFTELLRLHGLSQRELAELARVSQAFVSLLAHGRRGARPETAWRIATALGVLTDELFSSDTPHTPTTSAPAIPPMTAVATHPQAAAQSTAAHLGRHGLSRNRRLTRSHRPHSRRATPCTTYQSAA